MRLQRLSLWGNRISDISSLTGLVDLEQLWLDRNDISDISALSELVRLKILGLTDNEIADISPLIDNTGLEEGDTITLSGNPLDYTPGSATIQAIDALKKRGVKVEWNK